MEFNAAPGLCGVTGAALYFFEASGAADVSSLALAARAFALEAEEVFFRHSLALCPAPPQNMQRLLANRREHSLGVSFPSFPSLLGRLGFLFCPDELELSGLDLLLDEVEVDLLSEEGFFEEDEGLAGLLDFWSLDL